MENSEYYVLARIQKEREMDDDDAVDSNLVSFTSLYNIDYTNKKQVFVYFEQLWCRADHLHACLMDHLENSRPCDNLRTILFYLGHPITVIIAKLSKKKLLVQNNSLEPNYIAFMDSDLFRWLDLDDKNLSNKQKNTLNLSKKQSNYSTIINFRKFSLIAMREAIYKSNIYTTKHMVQSVSTEINEKSRLLTPLHPEWAILMCIEHTHLTLETQVSFIRHLPMTAINKNTVSTLSLSINSHRAPMRSSIELIPKNSLILVQGGLVRWLGSRVEIEKSSSSDENDGSCDEEQTERLKRRADARRACRQGGSREMQISSFLAAQFKVSNGEFLIFVQSGGYEEEKLWSSKGWAWRVFANVTHPKWWIVDEKDKDNMEGYRFRDTLEEIAIPWDWPVEVSLWEVEAFLNWKNNTLPVTTPSDSAAGILKFRLPTEVEHILFNGSITGQRREEEEPLFEQAIYHGNNQGRHSSTSNLDWKFHSASPVDHFSPSPANIHDPAGNLWEWVIDDAPPSTDCERQSTSNIGSHAMVGGCWASSGDPATSARYNAGGSIPGRGILQQYASFRYILSDVDPRIIQINQNFT